MRRTTKPLRLIAGGLDYQCTIGDTTIGIVPLEAPAPPVDAVVVEQDTHCLLAADNFLIESNESLPELTSHLQTFAPRPPGHVFVKQNESLQLYAIVHDLDLTPSWREEWISGALDAILDIALQRELKILGMPALGSIHGRYPAGMFIPLLVNAVTGHPAGPLQIWLGIPRADCADAIQQLKQHCNQTNSAD